MTDTLLDLAEAGKVTDPLSAGLQVMIVEEEPLLERLPWVRIPQGKNAYEWFREVSLPTASFRAVNGTWDADFGRVIPKREPLAILGGEVEIDTFILDTMGGKLTPDIKRRQYEMKMRAAKQKWLETFFEGDTGVDINAFDGLRPRVAGTNMDLPMGGQSNTNALPLTLDRLDEAIDAVRGGPSCIIGNQWIRRKINALVRSSGQAFETVSTTFGKQLSTYAGVPILVIQRENDMSSILDFDEDPGDGGDDAASIYLPRFGREDVFGILGFGGAWEVRDHGEQEAAPRVLGRLQVYVGLVTAHPRSVARISKVGKI